jgi:hypothetical protein
MKLSTDFSTPGISIMPLEIWAPRSAGTLLLFREALRIVAAAKWIGAALVDPPLFIAHRIQKKPSAGATAFSLTTWVQTLWIVSTPLFIIKPGLSTWIIFEGVHSIGAAAIVMLKPKQPLLPGCFHAKTDGHSPAFDRIPVFRATIMLFMATVIQPSNSIPVLLMGLVVSVRRSTSGSEWGSTLEWVLSEAFLAKSGTSSISLLLIT